MSIDHARDDDAVWGRPPAEPRPWGRRETAMAAVIAAVIAGLGGAAIYAATGSTSSSFMGPPGQHGPGSPGGWGGPDGPGGTAGGPPASGGGAPGRGQGPPLHSEVVVADGSGGFATLLGQSGTVTATAPSSITVRSQDGFTQTWSTSAGQGGEFGVGDSVIVAGRRDGATPRVTEVLDPARTRR